MKVKTPVKAPVSILISSDDESPTSSTSREKIVKRERVGVVKKLMNKNQLPPKMINSRKVVHQEFKRSQRGRIIRKPNNKGFDDDYDF